MRQRSLTLTLAMLFSCSVPESSGDANAPPGEIAALPAADAAGPPAAKNEGVAAAAKLGAWKTSFQADSTRQRMGGSELRALVPFDGKLYASNDYWEDSAPKGPDLPGAQIFALDAEGGDWRVEMELDDVLANGARHYLGIGALQAVTVTTDGDANVLAKPVSYLLASPWSRIGGVEVYARRPTGEWTQDVLADYPGNVRSFINHVDSKTGVDIVIAGSSAAELNDENAASAFMYHATVDRASRTLAWSDQPEPWATDADIPPVGWRVMAMAEANGKLYATVGASLYERIDGPKPKWRLRYTGEFPDTLDIHENGGLRGLHAVRAADGNGDDLLVGACGPGARILRIDVLHGFAESVDQSVTDLLGATWGVSVYGALVAYNDMLEVPDP